MSTKKKATRRRAAKKTATKRTKGAAKKQAPKTPAKAKTAAATLTPGATLERVFKGAKHTVKVTADGYRYEGETYRTLTAIAKKITGYAAVSGPRFFGTDDAAKKGGAA